MEGRRFLTRLMMRAKRHRFQLAAVVDVVALVAATAVAVVLRLEFDVTAVDWAHVAAVGAASAAVLVAVGVHEGLYQGGFRYGSFDEVAVLARTVLITTLIVAILNRYWLGNLIPVSSSLAAGFIALSMMASVRFAWRWQVARERRPQGDSLQRALVFGAGEGADQLLHAMLATPNSPYLPVGLLDDSPSKRHLKLRGIPVLGSRTDLAAAAEKTAADLLIVAVPSASAEVIRDLAAEAARIGLAVRVLPPVSDLLGDGVHVGDLRPITEEDLLGRHAIDTDIDAIAGYLTGRVVLVTGAGGSIGSELCRQIGRYAPKELVLLDRDESALHACQLSIDGRAQLDTPNLVVADIRDRERVIEVFERWRPQVVFHAAALKHVPLLEMHPTEAFKTNVWGTQHCLEAAAAVNVDYFVNISTDKAADPINVLGRTKRIAEELTARMALQDDGCYLSVRFGNVLGSRGSVLTAFRAQIEAGGPVTVTDPEVTRYFMTVEESVQLVIQAGAIGKAGEVLVLDMGEPVRIADVAQRLVEAAARDVEIVYTGLRPGEKMHEVLFAAGEHGERREHPLIWHLTPSEPLSDVSVIEVEPGVQH